MALKARAKASPPDAAAAALLPMTVDWRWLLDREDSPWYPTARLFRQTRSGDWDSVVTRVQQALANREFGFGR